jgi:multidrug resistance efflux pump
VISTDGKYIESYVEERDIVKISEGQKVNISLEAIENYSFTGRVVYVSNK